MKIVIFWNNEDSQKLLNTTRESLEWLWLNTFIELENINSEEYKKKLNINSDIAFCIEEDSIWFEDIIFEWKIASREELDWLLMSIIGWQESGWCSSSCSSCSWC